MKVFSEFSYTGTVQDWNAPAGLVGNSVLLECWGASGGMPAEGVAAGGSGTLAGGSAAPNTHFTNDPSASGDLGVSYANNAGYASGVYTVTAGQTLYVVVGGNGGPGAATIRNSNGNYYYSSPGGAGGYNGGASGGGGAETYQNLYNSTALPKINFTSDEEPSKAKVGQYWHDTFYNVIRKCSFTYDYSGGVFNVPISANWDLVTARYGARYVGSGGGGGGGATDIRTDADDSSRILVAGGGGGAGGLWVKDHSSQDWTLQPGSTTPSPPFGTDAGTANGPDKTWATSTPYFSGGWGVGGIGGATGPAPAAGAATSGSATTGGNGGYATGRHAVNSDGVSVAGSQGQGGSGTSGGAGGGSGTGSGTLVNGGEGATAVSNYDGWVAGGGGGGGGFYGGGGGGQGFWWAYTRTRGGGGGGGSNFASSVLANPVLIGAARPPSGAANSGTGANGNGGFARVSYHLAPTVTWNNPPALGQANSAFPLTFVYSPAKEGGAGIHFYSVGTATDPAATEPTSQTTIMVNDPTQTTFTYSFLAPAAGATEVFFVRVTDTDNDQSQWIKQIVTASAPDAHTPATITAPAPGSIFESVATVSWAPGTQTPEAAYKLSLSGSPLNGGGEDTYAESGWRRGGSRINFATDPGFTASTVWSSAANASLVGGDTTAPGVSGANGKISWTLEIDGLAENHTTSIDNLLPGQTYRLHIGVASTLANDPRSFQVQAWDSSGLLASASSSVSALAADTYTYFDLQFTPTGQGVYFAFVPSTAGQTLAPTLLTIDFENDTLNGFSAGTISTAQFHSGKYSLELTSASSRSILAELVASGLGAGLYSISGWVYLPAAATPTIAVSGTGVVTTPLPGQTSGGVVGDWSLVQSYFSWDGDPTHTVNIAPTFAAGGIYWDDFTLAQIGYGPSTAQWGNADTGQVNLLSNMMVELVYEEDAGAYLPYFDGSHLNGNTGSSVGWLAAANASPSILTGVDVTSGDISYTGPSLLDGEITLTTWTTANLVAGGGTIEATVAISVNPSAPEQPLTTLTIDNTTGLMTLTMNANDGSAENKTVSYDIFRSFDNVTWTRIATALTPDSARTATFMDAPGIVQVWYKVRAFDDAGGYSDQTDGTVTVIG